MSTVIPTSLTLEQTPDALIQAIREGLEYASFETLQADLKVTQQQLAEVMGINKRTLQNRKRAGRLTPQESDHLLRIARVFAQAHHYFGTPEQARAWLKKPGYAFKEESPLSLLDTEVGAEQVLTLLKQLEYGVLP